MKHLLIILLIAIPISIHSQIITKREDIVELKRMSYLYCKLSAERSYKTDSLINVNISLQGHDDTYPEARSFITVFYGSPQAFKVMLDDMTKFFDQDFGTSTHINNGNTLISIEKIRGLKDKYLFIHDDKVSFTMLDLKSLDKLRISFTAWAKKNNIQL